MQDVFSKTTAIVLGCMLMFITPVRLAGERQKNMFSTYLFTETAHLVDSVCNKGILYQDTYETYLDRIGMMGELYQVVLEHYSVTEDKVSATSQITGDLSVYGSYPMKRGDLIKVTVMDHEGVRRVFYGGCIKDEDY